MRLFKFLNLTKYYFLNKLYYIIFFKINYFKISNLNNYIYLYCYRKSYFLFLINFFFFSFLQLKILNDICVVDYYNKKNRFKVIYNFSNLSTGLRFFLIFFLKDKNTNLISIANLYKSANWVEREIWDLFGIFFFFHKDLRRILTDYGFKGYPLKKDFPLTGYVELRFDDQKRDIVYEPLNLTQELRFFNFSSDWELDN